MVYLNKDWFTEVSGVPFLSGSKCRYCGSHFFPPRKICLYCSKEEIEKISLSRKGELYTYTVVHIASKHFMPPYVVGYINLPEGIRIFSQIKDWDKYELRIGMTMELCIDKLWEDGDRNEIIGYKFRPALGDDV